MKENVVFFGLMAVIMGFIYLGFDFSLILFLITAIAGLIWAGYVLFLKKAQMADATASGDEFKLPEIVEHAKSFFPILLIIFVLRSFLFEPFRIPSGSMKPTLVEGDFILVNKFSYGIRLPILNKKVLDTNDVKRGDVAVFRYPVEPRQDFIKRVIGLPGDVIFYSDDKELLIKPACHAEDVKSCPPVTNIGRELKITVGSEGNPFLGDIYEESLFDKKHGVVVIAQQPNVDYERYGQMIGRQAAKRVDGGFQWVVPEGHYFMMGDNRDQSSDGRFWGFVPDDHLKGRAVAVWMHLDFGLESKVFGWVPTGISFSRIGGIE